MNCEVACRLGRETLAILEGGGYTAPSRDYVDLRDALARAQDGTREYPPASRPQARVVRGLDTGVTVENGTVLEVGRRMAAAGAVAALNFASAESPGGGWLNGARAQEESIARSSGLYVCLRDQPMYDYHRARRDAMYSDYVIYSPDVPVFRTDDGALLDEPWALSIITSPAVHGHGVATYVPHRLPVLAMAPRTASAA